MKKSQMAIVILIILAILTGTHALLYLAFTFLLNIQSHAALVVLRVAFGVLSVSLMLTTTAAFYSYALATRIIYRIAAGWMVFFYFGLMFSVLGLLARLLIPMPASVLLTFGITTYALASICAICALMNAGRSEVVQITVPLKNLPAIWNEKSIVFVSDLHLGHVHGTAFLEKIIAKINALHPEAVIIGGDLFDGSPMPTDSVSEALRGLRVPSGSYFVTGNHEQFRDDTVFLKAIRAGNVRVLDNEAVELHGILLAGVDDYGTRTPELLRSALTKIAKPVEMPGILIKHVPSKLVIAADAGYDFSLSGHTHNGQMFPLGYVARWMYDHDYGMKNIGRMLAYVSSGVGTWGPPGRFFTKSEIVQIRFAKAN